jgi:SAM-dependent methyltransferase
MQQMGDDLVHEQIRYYSERAPEYDETTKPLGQDPLAPQGARLETALDRFSPRERVLEIACGTGSWTRVLGSYACEVTALDASAQMLDIARDKVALPNVRYIRADILEEFIIVRRRLRDGRSFDIVKVFYNSAELERGLRKLRWDVNVHSTGDLYWGEGRLSSSSVNTPVSRI